MDIQMIADFARQAWVVWLMIVFLAIVFWAFRPKNAKRFEEDANIIFKDDHKDTEAHHG